MYKMINNLQKTNVNLQFCRDVQYYGTRVSNTCNINTYKILSNVTLDNPVNLAIYRAFISYVIIIH